jgi:hypothetical protein
MKLLRHRTPLAVACAAALILLSASAVQGSNCSGTSTGNVNLYDLGTGLYLGQFQGGLYPNGQNHPPAAHHQVGLTRAAAVQPLDTDGQPDPNGKVVLLSIGMSNTTQEWCSTNSDLPCNSWTFMGRAAASSQVNHTDLVIVNGAKGGQTAQTWDSPTDPNYDRVRDTKLAPAGVTEAQVQAVWLKVADANPTVHLPSASADAYALLGSLGSIARTLKVRYPNLQLVFVSSRIYGGYATTTLNPEPYAYESGFAVKWLIQAQIQQEAGGPPDPIAGNLNENTVAPWLIWGPYLWADGLTPRSDGLTWQCSDFETSDGTHPAQSGESKVGQKLLQLFLNSPYAAPWFPAP